MSWRDLQFPITTVLIIKISLFKEISVESLSFDSMGKKTEQNYPVIMQIESLSLSHLNFGAVFSYECFCTSCTRWTACHVTASGFMGKATPLLIAPSSRGGLERASSVRTRL